jgi:hypothetical protein
MREVRERDEAASRRARGATDAETDALAAAYASANRYLEAVRVAEEALAAARAAAEDLDEIRERSISPREKPFRARSVNDFAS